MTTLESEEKAMDIDRTLKPRKEDSYLGYLLRTKMEHSEHIPCKRTLVTMDINNTVQSTLSSLSIEGFQSAPIMENNKCVGFVDMLCLVKWVTDLFGGATSPEWINFWGDRRHISKTTIREVMQANYFNTATMQPEVCFEDNCTFHAMEIMAKSGAHRIAILNNRTDRKLVGIFTQSMVISELRQRQSLVSTFLEMKVSQCIKYFKNVRTIKETDKAINGFKTMALKQFTGLAVVTSEGVLTDTLSVSDLKAIGSDGAHLEELFNTVKEFKAFARTKIVKVAPKAHYSGKETPVLPIMVSPNQTLGDVLNKMDDGNIHRIWVCSEDSINDGRPAPTNLITQTDFIQLILDNYCYMSF